MEKQETAVKRLKLLNALTEETQVQLHVQVLEGIGKREAAFDLAQHAFNSLNPNYKDVLQFLDVS